MDFYLISVLIFALILALIFYMDRKNVKRESIVLLRRTQRGKKLLTKIGQTVPRFWKAIGTVGVVIGFCSSVFIVWWLIGNLVNALTTETATTGLAFVLPAPTATAVLGPGYLLVPFWYWIISIGLLILVHEGFHGIMSAMERVRIKSLGWGALLILPLAFVEPDEKQLAKKSSMSQLRVYAAGSLANFILAAMCLFIFTFSLTGLFVSTGVGYQALVADYPAASINLTGTIISINGYEIKNSEDLDVALSYIGPNETITITTMVENNEREFTLKTADRLIPKFNPSWIDDFVANVDFVIPGTVEFSKSLGGSSDDWVSLHMEIQYWQFMKEKHPHLTERADDYIEEISLQLEHTPEPGFIGILGVFDAHKLKAEFVVFAPAIEFLSGLLFFLFIINFGVGLANLLPIKPLDGGRMWYIVLLKYAPKRANKIIKYLSWAILVLLIANFVLPMLF